MRIASGPRWMTPRVRRGNAQEHPEILPYTTAGDACVAARRVSGVLLEKDLECELGRAAVADQVDRAVQVDVVARASVVAARES